jgi:hypothetical protein
MANAFDPEVSGLTPFITQLGSGVLEGAAVTLDYLTAGAQAFMEGLSAGLGPLGEAFGPANQDNLTKFKTIMEGVGTSVASLAKGIGWVIDKYKTLLDYIYKFGEWQSTNSTYTNLMDKFIAPWATQAPSTGSSEGTTQQQLVRQARLGNITNQSSIEPLPSEAETMSPMEMADAYGLPRMAKGAIVRGPTVALLGEAGHEVVAPLRRSPATAQSGQTPIVVNAPMTFNFTGGTQAEARATSESVAAAVESQLFSILERLALQSGRHA